MSWIKDKITIRGREIPTLRGKMRHVDLKYYKDNPRIYAIIRPDEKEPAQEDIERALQKMDHVKVLIQDIKLNGGLIDPIIVHAGTKEVLEGNSRLAAYRRLAEKDPIQWGEVDCVLLPETIEESQVFTILGQYHIIGKKDWAPFEQAGYLFRRHTHHGKDKAEVALELGIRKGEVDLLVRTYQFMLDYNDNKPDRWSYYYEYLRSRKIATLRAKYPEFDDIIVRKVKTGEIDKAVDIRDKLPTLSGAKPRSKVVRRFLDGEIDLDHAVEVIDVSGSEDSVYKRLNRFRTWLVESHVQRHITRAKGGAHNKIKFEINKIAREASQLKKQLDLL